MIVHGIEFPDDATPQEIQEFLAADSTSAAAKPSGGLNWGQLAAGLGIGAGATAGAYGVARAAGSPTAQRFGRAVMRGSPVVGPISKEFDKLGGGSSSKATFFGPPGGVDLGPTAPAARPRAKPAQPKASKPVVARIAPKPKVPSRPITVSDGSKTVTAAAPEPTPGAPYAGKGQSSPELARRTASLQKQPDLMKQLSDAVKGLEMAKGAGVPTVRERGAELRGAAGRAGDPRWAAGPPIVELLLMLLNASHAQEDMNAADQALRPVHERGMLPNDPRRWANQPHGI